MARKLIRWSPEKDRNLRSDPGRLGIGLRDCARVIIAGQILADIPNPNYPNQRMFVIAIRDYAFAVPYIEENGSIFLKTAFPSRKLTAIYLRRQ
ncbi:toxin [Roseitalea porphyridii]|uniref:Toxin n=1 Tax=Roseitalea porphyridii TaxID=1852022 RepID=A0A4P6V396_9HYPH|nr:toxin [Roseitalea porphyridii]QBK31373.1 toxin [Roseitalea porphyridii]